MSNLLDILAACTGVTPHEAAAGVATYGRLQEVTTDEVLGVLEPLQRRCADLADDPEHVDRVHDEGAERCRTETAPVLTAAREAIGL